MATKKTINLSPYYLRQMDLRATTSDSSTTIPLAVKTAKDLNESKLNIAQSGKAGQNVYVNSNGNIDFEQKQDIPSPETTLSNIKKDISGGSVGTSTKYAKADHQHPLSDAYISSDFTSHKNKNLATDNSGALQYTDIITKGTATPLADSTTGSAGTNSTQFASINHVHPQSNIYATSGHTHDTRYVKIAQGTSNKNVIVNSEGNIAYEDRTLLLPANKDLDAVTTTGFYHSGNYANSKTIITHNDFINTKIQNNINFAFSLCVETYTDQTKQTLTLTAPKSNIPQTYIRVLNNWGDDPNKWGNWYEVHLSSAPYNRDFKHITDIEMNDAAGSALYANDEYVFLVVKGTFYVSKSASYRYCNKIPEAYQPAVYISVPATTWVNNHSKIAVLKDSIYILTDKNFTNQDNNSLELRTALMWPRRQIMPTKYTNLFSEGTDNRNDCRN